MKKKSNFTKYLPYLLFLFSFLMMLTAGILYDRAIQNKQDLSLKILEEQDKKDIEKLNKFEQNRDISNKVVDVFCNSPTPSKSIGGTGIVIDENGLILTNSHIIPHSKDKLYTEKDGCMISFPDPETGQATDIYWANPILKENSEDYDLAFLQIYKIYTSEEGETFGEYPRKFEFFDNSNICKRAKINLGEKVTAFGYPSMGGGYNLMITEGIVSGFTDDGYILTSAKIDAGNSGGIAIDENGCMLGVASGVYTGKYESLGIIIPTSIVDEFLKKVEKQN